jgi:tetratricopeptide (TPR) repeat protein
MIFNRSGRTFLLGALAALALLVTPAGARAQSAHLGTVNFPTSGSPEAQHHFLRGVAALHSFWYEEALEEFQAATKVDPDFMMGYWGEAMTYNHPLWAQQDTEAGRKAVARIKDSPKLTERERGFLDAVRKLYGDGDKLARDRAYSAAMEKLYNADPADQEVASFYSLSILGTVRPGDNGFSRQNLAGRVAQGVFKKNPDHPGAAHYIIHAFDDPQHAIIALVAARRYSEIAPAAHHARHMPSHIFLQLGMWPEAASSNESAWAASDEWVKRKKLHVGKRDYHSLHWLLYVYLQQGRQKEAERLLDVMRRSIAEAGGERQLGRPVMVDMAAIFIVETARWDLAETLFPAPAAGAAAPQEKVSPAGATAAASHCAPGGAYAHDAPSSLPARGLVLTAYIKGLSAAMAGRPQVEGSVAELRSLRQRLAAGGDAYRAREAEIMETGVTAASAAAKGNYEEAVALMRKAVALEEEMSPPSGPPDLIKPSHELLGEILLRACRPEEAAREFKTALLRQPNRARSMLGYARAARDMKSPEAARAYASFWQVWSEADPQLAELREAVDYVEKVGAQQE